MIDVCIIFLYFIVTLIIGLYSGRKIKSMRDFSVADKGYATPVLVATISATWIGGEDILGITEQVHSTGIIFAALALGGSIAKLIIAKWIAPRMGRFANMISVGDIMGSFYGDTGRIITGLAGAIMETGFVGAQIIAIGHLASMFLGISFGAGICLGCGIVVLYSTVGGIRAVTTTDVLQFVVLIVAIPMICNVGLNKVGGYNALFNAIPDSHARLFPVGENPWKYITLFLIFCIPKLSPAITQRMLMARDVMQIRRSMFFSALAEVPLAFIVGCMGLIALVLAPDISPAMATPYLIENILPEGIKGLAVAGLFAVIMSSADSDLNAASITLVHDVVRPLSKGRLSDRMELRLTQIATFVLGSLAIVAAISFETIIDAVLAAFNLWSPVVLIPLVAGIFGIRARTRAFVSSIITGSITFACWKIWGQPATDVGPLIPSLTGNAIGFFTAYWISGARSSEGVIKPGHRVYFKQRVPLSAHFTIKIPVLDKLAAMSAKRVESHGAQYMVFAVFAVFNFIVPYFMWTPCDCAHPTIMLTFRGIAGVLCVLLILRDFWSERYKRYLPLYWHFTLFYCLPFLTTYMLIDNRASMLWLLNMSLMLLLMVILVDWQSFIVLLLTGVITGCSVFWYTHGFWPVDIDSDTMFIATYMCFFAVLIGAIFSRNKELKEREKLQSLQAMAGVVAHEMRTPLTALRGFSRGLEKHLPALVEGYESARLAGMNVGRIDPMAFQSLKSMPQAQERISRKALTTIDMLLLGLMEHGKAEEESIYTIKDCVNEALGEYPFSSQQERQLVNVDLGFNFSFRGNDELMIHVLFNLLKNALYSVKAANKGMIYIWTEKNRHDYCLHFKDTGTGIPASEIPNIFKRFHTNKRQGTGLGLSFCKNVLESFHGHISCHSIFGEYTEFVMRFPGMEVESSELTQDEGEKLHEELAMVEV